MTCVTDIPECLLEANVLHFLNAKEALRALVALGSCYCQTLEWNWTQLLINDTQHLTPTTRKALQRHYESTTIDIGSIHRIYTSQTVIHIKHHQLTVLDIGFHPSSYTFRGLCWSSTNRIHWNDQLTRTEHQRAFDWLVLPPWELANTHVFTASLPSDHTHVPPAIVSIVGEPEDTICLTNFNCLYRFSIHDNAPPHDYEDVVLGGRFESSITHLQLKYFAAPFLVVSGQPLWYNASSHYKCFGVWNVDQRTSVLPTALSNEHQVKDYVYYECMCMSSCGNWLYWKFNHTLCRLHLSTQHLTVFASFPPFVVGRVCRITVCPLKGWIGVYYTDERVWKLFAIHACLHPENDNSTHPLWVFKDLSRTHMCIHPFRNQFQFWRNIGTKVLISTLRF